METRSTKSTLEAAKDLALDECSEPDCGITIMVDKADKEAGRKFRCTACLMRMKLPK